MKGVKLLPFVQKLINDQIMIFWQLDHLRKNYEIFKSRRFLAEFQSWENVNKVERNLLCEVSWFFKIVNKWRRSSTNEIHAWKIQFRLKFSFAKKLEKLRPHGKVKRSPWKIRPTEFYIRVKIVTSRLLIQIQSQDTKMSKLGLQTIFVRNVPWNSVQSGH